jgi:hypothetical protein
MPITAPVIPITAPAPAAYRLFAVMWALAVAFHVMGNPRLASPAVQGLLAVGVVATAFLPGRVLPLALLCAGVVAGVWDEAPVLGNHWLLAGLVSLAFLLSAALGRDPGAIWASFAPAARLTLLVFYAFAAFAKLNASFFDPAVSCAVFYFRESAASFGIDFGPLPGIVEHGLVLGTAAIELAIPVLLAWPATRPWGVIIAIAFHLVLALDRAHQFFDFSSVLTALFVLFVPAFADRVADGARGSSAWLATRWPGGPGVLHLLGAVGLGAPVLVAAAVRDWPVPAILKQVGLVGFWILAGSLLIALLAFVRRGDLAVPGTILRPARAALLVVPVVALLNGLTPYLELKTAHGWNMYANLRTVDGRSNHFLVPATLPLTDAQAHLVRILASSDPGLRYYAYDGYDLPWDRFRDYLSRHPDASVTYRRKGETVHVARAGDVAGLAVALPEWRRRLLLHRAVDASGKERCLTGFGPAN